MKLKACVFHDTGAALRDRRLFEIVEGAYNRHENVVIYAASAERAAGLDRALWVLKQESFIPHKIFTGEDAECSVPVAIVTEEWNPLQAGILIADGHCSLEFAFGFEIVHEFVDRSNPRIQEACRDRYRAYRSRQIPVEHQK